MQIAQYQKGNPRAVAKLSKLAEGFRNLTGHDPFVADDLPVPVGNTVDIQNLMVVNAKERSIKAPETVNFAKGSASVEENSAATG